MDFQTKDSGKREEFSTGMVRDTEEGKPRFDLLWPVDIPFAKQMLTRFAALMARGAMKYGERNWEKASTLEEYDRARSSAARHFAQWMADETDEDHAAAVMFNLMAAETIEQKLEDKVEVKQDIDGFHWSNPCPSFTPWGLGLVPDKDTIGVVNPCGVCGWSLESHGR